MSALAVVAFVAAVVAWFVFTFIGMWKTLAKAGLPGWGALVPVYNVYLLWKLSQARTLLLVLWFLPLVSLPVIVIVHVRIAARFGRSLLFGVGLLLVPPVFWCVLGYGSAEWRGEIAGQGDHG